MIFTGSFWKATAERALSTAAQSALLVLGADQIDALQADWELVAGFAAGGFVLAVLKALAASKVGAVGPSLANEVISPPALRIGDPDHDTTHGPHTSGH